MNSINIFAYSFVLTLIIFLEIFMPATRAYLQQADVEKVLAAANAHAEKNNWAVTIAVVDDGGHLLGLIRRDGCATISAYISQEKARAAALGRRETKIYEDIINQGRTAFLAATPVLHGVLEGGVNILADGHTIGAVGVSGVKSEQDVEIAKAGISSLGLN
jgi:glc operon protein GlcG